MEDFQARAFQFKSYQKNFKVEVTKFEELEEVHAEVKLKQLLWDSLQEWDSTVDDLLKVDRLTFKLTICFIVYFGPQVYPMGSLVIALVCPSVVRLNIWETISF